MNKFFSFLGQSFPRSIRWSRLVSYLIFGMLFSHQLFSQSSTITINNDLTTRLLNSNGQWVRFSALAPDDIQKVETKMFYFPKRGDGVKGVEFRLRGADGGKAVFKGAFGDMVGYGGQGALVQFNIMDVYDAKFLVTYGKKGGGGATTIPVAAGGGGSTGMAWAVDNPTMWDYLLTTNPSSKVIAIAAGGGGGYAQALLAHHGKGGHDYLSETFQSNTQMNSEVCSEANVFVYSGSSVRSDGGTILSDIEKAASKGSEIFTFGDPYQTPQVGQQGGIPYTRVHNPYVTGGIINFCSGLGIFYPGAKGGSGYSGGGAGSATTSGGKSAGAGGGGTGTTSYGRHGTSTSSAWGGQSFCGYDASYIKGGRAQESSNGWFEFRTIADDIPPVAQAKDMTVYLPASGTLTVDARQVDNGSTDNDLVKSYALSKSTFTCSDLGTYRVILTVADAAGNKALAACTITVADNLPPYRESVSTTPRIIDITTSTVTLEKGHFPVYLDPCGEVTYSWPATTFDCSQSGQEVVVPLTVTDKNGNSHTYQERFLVKDLSNAVVYVDSKATGTNTGTSWANAFTHLQDALNYGCSNKTIYVATGTYYPDRGTGYTLNDRNASFVLRRGTLLYGGFPVGGTDFAARNHLMHPTILSGNINTINDHDNSYHVLTIPATSRGVLIEGFTIEQGNANGSGHTEGGGVYASELSDASRKAITFRKCSFKNNKASTGAAVAYRTAGIGGDLLFENCLFKANTASQSGGALYSVGANKLNCMVTMVNCALLSNTAGQNGGALHITTTSLTLTNGSLSLNSATSQGGALSSSTSNVKIENTSLWGDLAGTSGTQEIQNESSDIYIRYSLIQGSGAPTGWNSSLGTNAGNNLDKDPLYQTFMDLVVPGNSPLRNSGLSSANTTSVDLSSLDRVAQDTIDIGAYEIRPMIYVAADAPAGGDGTSWARAYSTLQAALDEACQSTYTKDIWIKKGTYYPTKTVNYESTASLSRQFTFKPCGYTRLFGGFAGTESRLDERNIPANPTILSGDLGTKGVKTDNAYHVVYLRGTNTQLDGLIIEEGYADHATNFTMNRGGGIFNDGGILTLRNGVLRNNYALNGGAIANIHTVGSGIVMDLVLCVLYSNSTPTTGGSSGGAIYNQSNSSGALEYRLTQVTGASNSARFGGFMDSQQISGSTSTMTQRFQNSLIWGNTASFAEPGIRTVGASSVVNSNSNIHGTDPQFVNMALGAGADGLWMTTDDGLRLQKTSTAINAGTNTLLPGYLTKDLAGQTRKQQNTVDQGAYEQVGCLGLTSLYVDATVATPGLGESWTTAFSTLAEALQVANNCTSVTSIHVAEGQYYPTGSQPSTLRDSSFTILRGGIRLYGGYPAGGGTRNHRTHLTYLNGDIGAAGGRDDNSYHIMAIAGIASDADSIVVDGFTFLNGYANGSGTRTYSGQVLENSYGGAVYLRSVLNGPKTTFRSCTFTDNSASGGGGAILCNISSSSRFVHCIFENNHTTGTSYGGGGLFNANNSSPTVLSSVFFKNSSIRGGAMYNEGVSPSIINSTFYNNYSLNNGAIYNNGASAQPTIINSILWGSNDLDSFGLPIVNNASAATTVTYSLVKQGYTGTGNSHQNPQFVGADTPQGDDGIWGTSDDGLRLGENSPAINTASNAALPATVTQDLTGAARIHNSTLDMGAYESSYPTACELAIAAGRRILYVDSSRTVSGVGESWATAFRTLAEALSRAGTCAAYDSILVAKGTYYPTGTQSGTDRQASFVIPRAGFALLGGYPNGGGDRALNQNQVILDGNIGNSAIQTDNSLHVVTVSNLSAGGKPTVIDGFTIQNGYNSTQPGAGIYGLNNQMDTLVLANSIVTGNTALKGAGVYVDNTSFQGIHCVFDRNDASEQGAGVYIKAGSGTLANVVFAQNTSTLTGGALMFDTADTAVVVNSTFFKNRVASVDYKGGAINVLNTPLTISNTLFRSNKFGGINGDSTSVACDVRPDGEATSITFQNSLLQSTTCDRCAPTGSDPMFTASGNPAGPDGKWGTADDGLRLQRSSPAVNTGQNDHLPTEVASDLAGYQRILNGTVDMGAYEYNGLLNGTIISIKTGNWQEAGTWDIGRTPILGDEVILDEGHTVSVMGTAEAQSIEYRLNAKLQFNNAGSGLKMGVE